MAEINPNLIANARLARSCEICLNSFEIWSNNDERRICPECRDKLYALLYPIRDVTGGDGDDETQS